MEFIKTQFDKILLSILLIFSCILVVLLIHWNMAESVVTWATSMAAGFSGALLTLITGSRFNLRSSDKPPEGAVK